MEKLIIKDIIGSGFASDNEQGDLVFNMVNEKFKSEKDIYLDFSGLELITSAFLNNAIGKLFIELDFEDILNSIKITNIKDKGDIKLLKLVITNAINYKKSDRNM